MCIKCPGIRKFIFKKLLLRLKRQSKNCYCLSFKNFPVEMVALFVNSGTFCTVLMRLIFTPMKQTNSRLQMVLLGLLMDGGQYGERPSQKLASRQPLSSLHLSPKRRLHSAVQQGP